MSLPSLLIIDDESDLVELLGDLLSARFEIKACQKTEQALVALSQAKFDLILSDLNMPGAGASGWVTQLKSLANSTPIVCMSGYDATHPLVIAALEEGARAVVKKPFESAAALADLLVTHLKASTG